MKKLISILLLLSTVAQAQNISSRSSAVSLDFSDSKKNVSSSFPKITWQSPENEVTFLKDGKVNLKLKIESKQNLKSVTLTIRDKETKEAKASTSMAMPEDSKLFMRIDKNIVLLEGANQIEIIVENQDGLKTTESREVHVGATALADAAKLGRNDYALIFATDKYDNWKQLVNPIFDAHAIADDLRKTYGFNIEVVENPTQAQVFDKLSEYAGKKYNPLDQLFIFFAGHGYYDETLKEGFVVTRESLPSDPGGSSYIRHSALKSTINNNPCDHVFLVMDVCFGGTFDDYTASRGDDEVYDSPSQSEIITRKLQFKTRKYMTSGGKEYVSDGIAGKHSPFAKEFIEGLEKGMGNDGILTLSELYSHVERLKTEAKFGSFGNDKQGSDFVFVVKGN